MICRLYGKYAHPLARIVQGIPMSWDSAIVSMKPPSKIMLVVCSPCGRFLAVCSYSNIQIVDALTLKELKSLVPQWSYISLATFSAEGHLLLCIGGQSDCMIWDLQTGIQIQYYHHSKLPDEFISSITCSGCERMFGVLSWGGGTTYITTYAISGVFMHLHKIEGSVNQIWTHGEYIRFATLEPEFIIWEIGFTSEHPPVKVGSLSTPSYFSSSKRFLFLPTPSRFAIVLDRTVNVWDACHSKLLLHSVDVGIPMGMSFTSDGHFFAYSTSCGEISLWRESPTGYTLHQKLASSLGNIFICDMLLISPNGQSIITYNRAILQLYHTMDSITSPSGIPTQPLLSTEPFILGFSPDQSLAVVAQFRGYTVTVLNLKSGIPQLIIDAGMDVYGVGVAESTVVVVGNERIATWNLPRGDRIPVTRANVDYCVRTTMFYDSRSIQSISSATISPDLKYMAVMRYRDRVRCLSLFNTSTGKHIIALKPEKYLITPQFSLAGSELWGQSRSGEVEGWVIGDDSEPDFSKPKYLGDSIWHQSEGCPWNPSYGYQVTDGGWILNSSGKHMLWLPPHWRSIENHRVWHGKFLAFLHYALQEVCILELLEE